MLILSSTFVLIITHVAGVAEHVTADIMQIAKNNIPLDKGS